MLVRCAFAQSETTNRSPTKAYKARWKSMRNDGINLHKSIILAYNIIAYPRNVVILITRAVEASGLLRTTFFTTSGLPDARHQPNINKTSTYINHSNRHFISPIPSSASLYHCRHIHLPAPLFVAGVLLFFTPSALSQREHAVTV